MDNSCEYIKELIEWLNPLESIPIAYIGEDRGLVSTRPHPYLEIGFHAAGPPVEVTVKDKKLKSTEGSLIILNAHFGNKIISKQPWSYCCLSFNVENRQEFKDIEKAPLLIIEKLENFDALNNYKRINEIFESSELLKNARLKLEVMRFLFKVNDCLNRPDKQTRPVVESVKKGMDFIHAKYHRHDLTLGEIAKSAGLSSIHFGRTFKRELGITPMKYLTNYRLKKAEELLKRSDLFIGEVGNMVGFADRLHFSRVFSAGHGRSPREYRRNLNLT